MSLVGGQDECSGIIIIIVQQNDARKLIKNKIKCKMHCSRSVADDRRAKNASVGVCEPFHQPIQGLAWEHAEHEQ